MPEITDGEYRLFISYQELGSPTEVKKKITDLESDNHALREDRRKLREKVPGEGSVVVTQDEADRLAKFDELGTPKEVSKALQEGTEAKEEAANLRTFRDAKAFAGAVGIAEEAISTLVAMPGLKGATFSVEDGKVKNEKGDEVDGKVGRITLPGAEKGISFEEAAEQVPELRGIRMAESQTRGVRQTFVPQGSTPSKGKGGDVYERIREKAEKKREAAKSAASGETGAERLRRGGRRSA